jgi:hypothetical protein
VTAATTSSGRSTRSTSSPESEPSGLADFVRFCAALRLAGKPFILEPFQRTILRDYFAGTTQTLAIIPKKNGKSTLVAALALYHLLVTEDAEGYIAASSRDQAAIILKQARKFIRATPALQRHLGMKQREIVNLGDEGFIRVIASDVETADGVIPTLAIVDELHRHKSTDLMGVFRDGLGPRDGQMITITTAGDDSESPLGVMRSRAYAMPVVERDGSYRYARSRDGQWVMHEWALDDSEDREDMDVVKSANPASWHTVTALRRRGRIRRLLRGSGRGLRAACGCRARTPRSARSSGRAAGPTRFRRTVWCGGSAWTWGGRRTRPRSCLTPSTLTEPCGWPRRGCWCRRLSGAWRYASARSSTRSLSSPNSTARDGRVGSGERRRGCRPGSRG